MSDPTDNTKAGEISLNKKWEAARETALLALKYALFINGGAAVALLAFIGAIWSPRLGSYTVIALIVAVASFAPGVFSAAVAVWVAYKVDLSEFLATRTKEKEGPRSHVREEAHHESANRSYGWWQKCPIACFTLFLLGVIAFCVVLVLRVTVREAQTLNL